MAESHQEEEVSGKAYDSRLMKRLLRYLAPYKWQTILALVAIVLKAFADVIGPYLTKTAIDKYLASGSAGSPHTLLDRWLGTAPWLMFAGLALGFGGGVSNLVRATNAASRRR